MRRYNIYQKINFHISEKTFFLTDSPNLHKIYPKGADSTLRDACDIKIMGGIKENTHGHYIIEIEG